MKIGAYGAIGNGPFLIGMLAFGAYSVAFSTPWLLTTHFGGRGLWGPCEQLISDGHTLTTCVWTGHKGLWHFGQALFALSLLCSLLGLMIICADRWSTHPSPVVSVMLVVSAVAMVVSLTVLLWITSDAQETIHYRWSLGWGFFYALAGLVLSLLAAYLHRRQIRRLKTPW